MNANDLSRREFNILVSNIIAGWLAGFRPIVPQEYVLSIDFDEDAVAEAVKVDWGGTDRILDPDDGLLMSVPVSVDVEVLWRAVTITDQYDDVWKIEGAGEALVAPWGERLVLKEDL